jgi:hypothetical protein
VIVVIVVVAIKLFKHKFVSTSLSLSFFTNDHFITPSTNSLTTQTLTYHHISTPMAVSLHDVTEESIPSLPASELKRLLSYHNVNYEGCFEKREFVELAITTKRSLPPKEPPQPAIVPYFGREEREKIDYYAVLEVARVCFCCFLSCLL